MRSDALVATAASQPSEGSELTRFKISRTSAISVNKHQDCACLQGRPVGANEFAPSPVLAFAETT